jgi:5-formyltetrahydrofolate cyclo-ligase
MRTAMPVDDRAALRRRLRAGRRSIGAAERAGAGRAARDHLLAAGLPRPGARVAIYLPMDGEFDTAAIVAAAYARRCQVFVPVITDFRARRMSFVPLRGRRLAPNRWGVVQPVATPADRIDPRWLDLVIMPCVGVDRHGHRLGMGAGFYDRRFAFLSQRSSWRRPRLVALAYDFQVLPALAPERWDVPAWAILTPRGFRRAT